MAQPGALVRLLPGALSLQPWKITLAVRYESCAWHIACLSLWQGRVWRCQMAHCIIAKLRIMPQSVQHQVAPVLGATLTVTSTSQTGSGEGWLTVDDGDADMAVAEF